MSHMIGFSFVMKLIFIQNKENQSNSEELYQLALILQIPIQIQGGLA